jgi:hypothetical protein
MSLSDLLTEERKTMRNAIFISMFVIPSVLLAACAGTLTPAATASKPVNIKMETDPNPAVMGDMELVLNISDANGNPIEGAKVDVSADHTDMSGMNMSGLATDQGGGRYSIKANFSMSGNWKLTVYVRKDGLDYEEDIDFKVQ